MEIIRPQDTKTVKKPSGTEIVYHLFNEYEINVNTVPPHSKQDWHYHKGKEEVVLVTRGSILVEWEEDSEVHSLDLVEGDLVRVESTPHRFLNISDTHSQIVCFKLVLTGENKRNILAGDKFQK